MRWPRPAVQPRGRRACGSAPDDVIQDVIDDIIAPSLACVRVGWKEYGVHANVVRRAQLHPRGPLTQ